MVQHGSSDTARTFEFPYSAHSCVVICVAHDHPKADCHQLPRASIKPTVYRGDVRLSPEQPGTPRDMRSAVYY